MGMALFIEIRKIQENDSSAEFAFGTSADREGRFSFQRLTAKPSCSENALVMRLEGYLLVQHIRLKNIGKVAHCPSKPVGHHKHVATALDSADTNRAAPRAGSDQMR
jgi:hypothetical protein